MNWLDIVLVLIVGLSIAASFRKGLSRELIGLASVFVALVAGTWFYGMAGGWLQPYVSSRSVANFAGFFLVFFGVLVLGAVVSYSVGRALNVTGLSFFDHLLGAGFGLVRGTLIGVALILGIMAFSTGDRPPESVVHSRTAPYVVDAARLFATVAPHELKEGFRKSYAEVKSAWERTLRSTPDGDKRAHERKI
jgi:membrane protein required for colicin V production